MLLFKVKGVKKIIITAIFLTNISLVFFIKNELSDINFLKLIFFDVGQGDAILIKMPNGYKILVDAGAGEKIIEKIKKELPFYNKSIDLIIPTHPDRDHISGFIDLLDQLTVKSALIGGNFSFSKTYQSLIKKLHEKNVFLIKAISGLKIFIGRNAEIEIINPDQDISLKEMRNENNYATSFILTYGKRKFLFTADIEQLTEKMLLKKFGDKLNIDVLKVAHHGSKTSSSLEFLTTTSPGISIIQVGKNNPYGHPHNETLKNLSPSVILRNDERGDVVLFSDGQKIWVK